MYSDQTAAKSVERIATMNDRLNKTVDTLAYQCERIEAVLSRVNGTPQKIESAKSGGITPRVTLSMQNAIENLESTTDRLVNLANGVEQIA